MAQSFVTDQGTLIIPGAYPSIKVETANSGLATTGVLMLVGEADSGPRFSLEESLQDNSFGPDQLAAVQIKYGSGPLVDAFRLACAPANDPNIAGSPSRMVLVKTNDSAKATSQLLDVASADYAVLGDVNYGKKGNLIYYTISEATAEVAPTTGLFTWLLPFAGATAAVQPNGGAIQTATLGTLATPSSFVTVFDALTGVSATGGSSRSLLAASTGTIGLTASGNTVTISYSGTWGVTPTAGDTFFIPVETVTGPSDSVLAGGGGFPNAGSYVVVSATSSTIVATKLINAANGSLTAPVTVAPVDLSVAGTGTGHVQAWAPVSVSIEAGPVLPGKGKSLQISEVLAGDFAPYAYALSTTQVTWVSKVGAPKVLVSGAEQKVQLNVSRQVDNIQETLAAGGEVALKLAYTITSGTATVSITDSILTTTISANPSANLSVDLKDFPTISDLAVYINSQPGYTASVGSGILGQLPSTALDNVTTAGIASLWGAQAGRIKVDAYKFFLKVGESVLVRLYAADEVTVEQAASGLPGLVSAITYLGGLTLGSKGTTSDADVAAALLALEKVRGNFLVPLFSRDASLDVQDKLTEVGSSYTIEAVVEGAKSHVLKMSTLKRKKNRQAFVGLKDTFDNVKEIASNTASFRVVHTFQDIRALSADGTVKQYAPWMGAVDAAAMQAAGFYRAIVRKFANISGAIQAAKDFDDQDDSAMEDALLAGLLPIRRAETGGWYWVSDQTSYGKDSNFVFNSIQATYVADVVALTTAQRMENAFVGQSVADVNAALALAFLESIMGEFLRLKLISASDDAPRGFKNASIKISGTAMIVSIEIKLAGAIYFIPISFLVSQVQQSA